MVFVNKNVVNEIKFVKCYKLSVLQYGINLDNEQL